MKMAEVDENLRPMDGTAKHRSRIRRSTQVRLAAMEKLLAEWSPPSEKNTLTCRTEEYDSSPRELLTTIYQQSILRVR
jgi:hypothetical protein